MSSGDHDAGFKLAVDIGGTFTDVVYERGGRTGGQGSERSTAKVLTTHNDPADGVMEGIRRVLQATGARAEDALLVLHGTTLATNALIERAGATTALLTTAGHRDAVEMALENRFEQYDISIDRPQPLVPRPLRLPVKERLDAHGEVLVPLDMSSVKALLPQLVAADVQSIAIGFLHAYANPDHESRVAAFLREALPDVSLSLSSSVCPEIREYERLSTTCANAYVKPLMARYLLSLESQLAALGCRAPVLLMTSGGGLTTLDAAREYPIRLVESGPAGGTILAGEVARAGGFPRVLSFDMGGTTAKLCVIDDNEPLLSRSFEVDRSYRFKKGSGLPVRIPVIEMVEIGAGGGSIARVDSLNRVQVGPQSAGSEPGPACYGRGGELPTVTDADVVLGKISPGNFAGGRIQLDLSAARAAVDTHIAEPLKVGLEQGAYAISEVVNENMAAAARAHLSEWGKAMAGRTLIAFGGAAPLHACTLAHKLKLDRIVVPAHAGVGSAVGFLLAPVSFEVVRSRYMLLEQLDASVISELMADMYAEARGVVGALVPDEELHVTRRAFMRYLGQGYEIAVALEDEPQLQTAELRERFEAAYAELYGRVIPGLDVEILSWTLAVSGLPQGHLAHDRVDSRRVVSARRTESIYDVLEATQVTAGWYAREALEVGDVVAGPAMIVEDQTSTFVASGYVATVSDAGHLVLTREES